MVSIFWWFMPWCSEEMGIWKLQLLLSKSDIQIWWISSSSHFFFWLEMHWSYTNSTTKTDSRIWIGTLSLAALWVGKSHSCLWKLYPKFAHFFSFQNPTFFFEDSTSKQFRPFGTYKLGFCLWMTGKKDQIKEYYVQIPKWVRSGVSFDRYALQKSER